jgi:hypothetical protein
MAIPKERTDGLGKCSMATCEDGTPHHPEASAIAHDRESYWAILETKPGHGCASFEARE